MASDTVVCSKTLRIQGSSAGICDSTERDLSYVVGRESSNPDHEIGFTDSSSPFLDSFIDGEWILHEEEIIPLTALALNRISQDIGVFGVLLFYDAELFQVLDNDGVKEVGLKKLTDLIKIFLGHLKPVFFLVVVLLEFAEEILPVKILLEEIGVPKVENVDFLFVGLELGHDQSNIVINNIYFISLAENWLLKQTEFIDILLQVLNHCFCVT